MEDILQHPHSMFIQPFTLSIPNVSWVLFCDNKATRSVMYTELVPTWHAMSWHFSINLPTSSLLQQVWYNVCNPKRLLETVFLQYSTVGCFPANKQVGILSLTNQSPSLSVRWLLRAVWYRPVCVYLFCLKFAINILAM